MVRSGLGGTVGGGGGGTGGGGGRRRAAGGGGGISRAKGDELLVLREVERGKWAPMVEGPNDIYICSNCTELCQNIFRQEKRKVSGSK